MANDLQVKIKIQGDSDGVESAMRRVNAAIAALQKIAKSTGDSSEQMGTKMAASLGHYSAKAYVAVQALQAMQSSVKEIINTSAKFDSIEKSLLATSGSAKAAGESFDFIKETSLRLGLNLTSAAGAFANLQAAANGTALEGEQTRKIFTSVSAAMATLGKSSDDTQGALTAIGQMLSKGTVNAEELRGQLGERLPGAFQVMARAIGVSTAELSKMLEQGQVGIDVLPKFAAELDRTYKNANFDNIQSSLNRISTAWDTLVASAGKAVNLEVILKTVADIANPISDEYVQRLERINTLTSMINRREKFGVDASQYKTELDNLKQLDQAEARRRRQGLQEQNGTAPWQEGDAIIAEGNRIAEQTKMIIKGQQDAQSRLWDQNRKAIEDSEKQAQQAAQAMQSMFDSASLGLQKEIALRGDNSAAAAMEFDVQFTSLAKLSDAQKVKLLNMAAEKDRIEANTKAYKEYDDIIEKGIKLAEKQKAAASEDSQRLFNKFNPGYADLTNGISDVTQAQALGILDAEQAKAEFDKLGQAYNDGFLDKAKKGTLDLNAFSEQAARNIQSSFADFLFDPFSQGLDGMLVGFAKTIQRMVAEAASAQILGSLFGDKDGKISLTSGIAGSAIKEVGSSAWSGISGLFANIFHEGGVVGEGGRGGHYSPSLFVNAPRYHNGGTIGLKPDEVPAILQRGERVLTKGQQSSMLASSDVQISTSVTVSGGNGNNSAAIGDSINQKIKEWVMTEKRPGGMLA
jgi:tape measure domain-containing protein